MMNVSPSVDNINNFSLVVEDCFEDNKFEIKKEDNGKPIILIEAKQQ